jgi:hypothetical protein
VGVKPGESIGTFEYPGKPAGIGIRFLPNGGEAGGEGKCDSCCVESTLPAGNESGPGPRFIRSAAALEIPSRTASTARCPKSVTMGTPC